MQVNQVSSQSFGHVFNTKHVDRIARNNREFSQGLMNIRKILKDEQLDSLKYVDIILHHSEEMGGFYGVISSKKQAVPNVDYYRLKIPSANDISGVFAKWARAWDYVYSPEGQKYMNELACNAYNYVMLHPVWKLFR